MYTSIVTITKGVKMKKLIKTELIENYLKEKNLNKSRFCKECKISTGTLNKILSNKENFRINALFKIARTLGIQVFELFKS